MNDDENAALAALQQLLDMTDATDWPLVHRTVAEDITSGRFGAEFETAYRALVDKKRLAKES